MRVFVISRNIDIVEHWCVAASEIQKKMLKNMLEGARILIEFKVLRMKRTLFQRCSVGCF